MEDNKKTLKISSKIAFKIAIIIVEAIFLIGLIYLNMIGDTVVEKPIIYLYPEQTMKVTVELMAPENLTSTYPKYENKWEVIASPDGNLQDTKSQRNFYGLYWEGKNDNISSSLKEGFVVAKNDIIPFLEEKLEILGLNEREANEFIIYWLPRLEQSNYNYIRFETIEEINSNMPLKITPTPDTIIRVNMNFKPLDKQMTVTEQKLERAVREGFTVVEWGGTELK